MQVPPEQARLNALTPATVAGPVKVAVPAVQLTAYFHESSADEEMLNSGTAEPAAGFTVPSTSAGKRLA